MKKVRLPKLNRKIRMNHRKLERFVEKSEGGKEKLAKMKKVLSISLLSKEFKAFVKKHEKERAEKERKRKEDEKWEEIDRFIKEAKKVGLIYTRAQVKFLFDWLRPDQWDGRVGSS